MRERLRDISYFFRILSVSAMGGVAFLRLAGRTDPFEQIITAGIGAIAGWHVAMACIAIIEIYAIGSKRGGFPNKVD